MSVKNTKRNVQSICYIKYVTCAKVLQDLNTTLCFLSFKKSARALKRLPYTIFALIWKQDPCQNKTLTLSKALDMPKSTDRISWSSSKKLMCIWQDLVIKIVWKSHLWSKCLRMLGRAMWFKTATLGVLFQLVQSLRNVGNKRLLDHIKKKGFIIFSIISGFLDQ